MNNEDRIVMRWMAIGTFTGAVLGVIVSWYGFAVGATFGLVVGVVVGQLVHGHREHRTDRNFHRAIREYREQMNPRNEAA